MNDDFDYLLWVYRAVFKQTDAGGGAIKVTLTMNERTVILFGRIGQDDYAAGRVVLGLVHDTEGNEIARILSNSTVDNQIFHFPVNDHSAVTTADGPQLEKRLILGTGQKIILNAASLVQNEELTVAVQALIRNWPPTIVTTGSAGVVTTTLTYDKVI